ncbi:taxadiene 5-alpha hydroxylase-like [Impatiens glandulifera]|uniref:taxadiene 5-alpha hydroxylase-like n=1 Tax=Impatiens glandulifera TaxID=253017 RepID=UPI001FB154F8|nr:taxadiene 5-alpha hydroxylase-like [Impatiens glandulifera]
MDVVLLTAILLFSLSFISLLRRGKVQNLPRGSLGWPVIGETLSFLKAQKTDSGANWIDDRVKRYGKVFKTSLMGAPTIVIVGQAGNKFILGSDEDILVAQQPKTLSTIAGKNNIFELTGSRYKLIKGAMLSFLKPESLQNYITEMDEMVTNLLNTETEQSDTLQTVAFMKKITYNIACTVLFGFRETQTREDFSEDIRIAFAAVWSLPLNLPGTAFRRGLKARSRIVERLRPIMRTRRDGLEKGILDANSDVMTSLLSLRDEKGELLKEEYVVDNFITLLIASHDTSAILLSLMVWKMSTDKDVYNRVLEEQMEILRGKGGVEESLRWTDIQKMKYTWRFAQEIMRVIPPVFGSFRKAIKDTTFGSFDIPKGWQVFWVSHGTHMDEDIFENATKFDPNRFVNQSKPVPPYAYVPFGGGLHSCIGNEFARVESLISIHKLVTMFEWSLVHPNEVITRQPMPYPSMGLPIKLKPRL